MHGFSHQIPIPSVPDTLELKARYVKRRRGHECYFFKKEYKYTLAKSIPPYTKISLLLTISSKSYNSYPKISTESAATVAFGQLHFKRTSSHWFFLDTLRIFCKRTVWKQPRMCVLNRRNSKSYRKSPEKHFCWSPLVSILKRIPIAIFIGTLQLNYFRKRNYLLFCTVYISILLCQRDQMQILGRAQEQNRLTSLVKSFA